MSQFKVRTARVFFGRKKISRGDHALSTTVISASCRRCRDNKRNVTSVVAAASDDDELILIGREK